MAENSESPPPVASPSSESAPAAASSSDITINIKGPANSKLTLTFNPNTINVIELKELIAKESEKPKESGGVGERIAPESQRLIYSGRVLKDEDALDKYGLKSGHTMHLVKGAARAAPSSGGSSSSPPPPGSNVPQNLAAGQQFAGNPLAPLLNATNPGLGGFNPFTQMGLNPNDPNMMMGMLDNPEIMRQAAAAMQDPAMVDQVIAAHPEMAAMAPQIRQIMQSPMFRAMLSNPDTLRMMMQMQTGRGGGAPGAGGFPPPGAFGFGTGRQAGETPGTGEAQQGAGVGADAATPGGATTGQGGGPPLNPFGLQEALGLLAGAGAGANPLGGGGANPFGGGAGANPYGGGFPGMWGMGAPAAAPRDTRPPEERFETQLGQLREMGFSNASQNVRALMATGGDVQGAIEYILGGMAG